VDKKNSKFFVSVRPCVWKVTGTEGKRETEMPSEDFDIYNVRVGTVVGTGGRRIKGRRFTKTSETAKESDLGSRREAKIRPSSLGDRKQETLTTWGSKPGVRR